MYNLQSGGGFLWLHITQRTQITSSSWIYHNQNDIQPHDELIFSSIHFHSANGLLGGNYVCMKVTSIKICSNEDMKWEIHQLISLAYTVWWMWVLRNENHTIIPSVPSKNPPAPAATRWLLVTGIQSLQRSVRVCHTNIDFSQNHKRLIRPPEVGYLCKHNPAAINVEPWLDSLHWCNTEHQLPDRDGGGGRLAGAVGASSAAN